MINKLHDISTSYLTWEKPKTPSDVVLIALKAISYLSLILPLAALLIIKFTEKKISPIIVQPIIKSEPIEEESNNTISSINLEIAFHVTVTKKTLSFFPQFLRLHARETTCSKNPSVSELTSVMHDPIEYKTVPEGPILCLKLKVRFQRISDATVFSMKDKYNFPSTEKEQELRVGIHPDLPRYPDRLRLLAPQQLSNHRGFIYTLNQVVNAFSDFSDELHPEREVQTDFNMRWFLNRMVSRKPVQLIEQVRAYENYDQICGIWHVSLA